MEQQAAERTGDGPKRDAMPRRKALKRIAGSAVAGALVLAGCTPGNNAPTPVVTSTPSPTWTPRPAGRTGGGLSQAVSIEDAQTSPQR